MKKIQTMQELLAYMVGKDLPDELKATAKDKIKAVQECNDGGASAHLVIARTKEEAAEVEKEFNISSYNPEVNEFFKAGNGEWWWHRVYVFSDDGSGLIYFERTPLLS